jgi:hypothetical protein
MNNAVHGGRDSEEPMHWHHEAEAAFTRRLYEVVGRCVMRRCRVKRINHNARVDE